MKETIGSIAVLALCLLGVFAVILFLGIDNPQFQLSCAETVILKFLALFSLIGLRTAGKWIIKKCKDDSI